MTPNEHRDTHERDWYREAYDQNAEIRAFVLLCLLGCTLWLAVYRWLGVF